MIQPPPETFHLSFDPGPYRMAMGLTTVPEDAWFEIDEHYAAEIAERNHLLAAQRDAVFGAEPMSADARSETLSLMVEHLTRVHPAWFERTGNTIHQHLSGDRWDVTAGDPLEIAGRLVQEDLCLVQETPEGPRFTAAVLCFPSRWRLHEKLGRPLAGVHGGVPIYPDRLARPVDRFMAHLRDERIAVRLNWSVLDDPALFQPAGKWRTDVDQTITLDNAGDRLFLRVERQTFRRLPRSEAILFGIRVHVYPIARVISTGALAGRLASAIRALPPEMAHYKSLPMFQTALLGWLDSRAA